MTRLVAGLVVALLTALTGPPANARDLLLIRSASIVDVASGTVKTGQSVLIEDGVVKKVGTKIRTKGKAPHIFDARGGFLIPGLWDSHVHIFSTATEPDSALPLYLINGVTGVRDMGALWPIAQQQELQRRIERGELLGPRLVLSGAWADASPGSWPGMFLADTPEQARAVVNRIEGERWAAVKSYSMLSEASYRALAAAATSHGLQLVGHIPERVTLGTAIEVGHDGVDHFGRVTMACATEEDAMLAALRSAMAAGADRTRIFEVMATRNRIVLESWSEPLCARTLDKLAAARIHISPTLVVAGFYVGERPAGDTPRVRMLPPDVRAAWAGPDFRLDAMTDEVRRLAYASIALDHRTFLMAHRAGVPILASTDASFANPWLFHGFSLLDELDLYVRIGLTPREALYTATVAPPRFFGLTDQDGTIAPGRRADLVLLRTNPLLDLATLRRPDAVIVGGKLLDRAALSALEAQLLDGGQQ